MRVLAVDDDEIGLGLLARALAGGGHEVCTARNGREALDRLCRDEHRMVISDWEMPEMDGLELCRQIRQAELPGYVYVILLTCRDRPADAVQGLSAEADDFIRKPFEPAELLARVRTGERVLALDTRDVAIFALAKLAESRDPETGAHLERTRCYSRLIARHLASGAGRGDGIDAEFVRLIYLTSPLHDIGKVGIPDSVLLKPGRLSDREFEIMKTHTVIGAETLDAALRHCPQAKFLRMARDIAASHHERFDGTGYPKGLVGREIPLAGRIVALADVYDALTSRRVYKKAFAHDVARGILLEQGRQHFDPEVLAAFVEREDEFQAIQRQLADPIEPIRREADD